MKVNLPSFDTVTDVKEMARRLVEMARELSNAFGRVRVDDALIIGGGTKIAKYLSTTATWNPGSVAAAGQTSTTVTLTGAALGDVALCSFSLDLQLLQLTANVSAANTITCVLQNGTAGPIDLASGTLRVSVLQH